MNFVFQHAFYCHVCHCSWCVISYEPDTLSKISQVLEKSQENFAAWLTLNLSKQLVSLVSVRHRYIFSAFQNAQDTVCYRACKPSLRVVTQAWQLISWPVAWQSLVSRCFQLNFECICGAHCNRNKPFTKTSLKPYRLVLLTPRVYCKHNY